ncbi:MAG TPA: polysaccharide deacetylase family protein [Thermoanaerobaculia bacterium]|nr:polysaccharide deacetylase family protein [Thermoanaerobaculia bacterium]
MRPTPKLAPFAALGLALLAGSLQGAAAPAGRPILISVDDLPVAAGELHSDPAERERITRGLLAALEKHHVHAVGLVIWWNVKSDADRALLRRWLAGGHELGNHSAHHLDLTKTGADAYLADVEAGRAGLAAFLRAEGDRKVRFFRFPFLDEGDTAAKLDAVRAGLARSGQRNLPVTIDDQDWSFEKPWVEARRKGDRAALARVGEEYQEALHVEVRDQEERGDRILGRIPPQASPQILLLHANEVGAAQWDRLFTWLEGRGYRFAKADEVLADAVFKEEPRYVGDASFGLWDRFIALRRARDAQSGVEALLRTQSEAWNRGDLEAFTAVYAEDASFLSPTGLTQGRQQVLERYRRRYPDRKAMGTLSLEVLETRPAQGIEVTPLDDARPSRVHAVSVAARSQLAYPDQPEKKTAEGLTLLVLRRHGNSWEIVQDASM